MNFKLLFVILVFFQKKINANYDRLYGYTPELFYMDNYDTCMLLKEEAFVCIFKFALEPINNENPTEMWTFIKNISSIESNFRHDILRHSICVPKTCPGVKISDENDPLLKKALENCYNKKFKDKQLKGSISQLKCQTHKRKYQVDYVDIAVGILFLTYLLFILYATYYEITTRNNIKYSKLMISPKRKILSTFSVVKNWEKLKTINDSSDIKKFQSIQSIRFFNSLTVIFTHSSLAVLSGPVANTKMTEEIYLQAPTIVAGSASLSMAVFFFVSSFILSKNQFKKMDDKNKFTLDTAIQIIAKRLFRILPTLAAVVLFHTTWLHHFGNGPFWYPVDQEYQRCRKNGWTNILFLNKIVDPKNMCLLSSWYTAINTQYYILSIFFIWMLKKYEDYIWYILGATLSLTAVGTFLYNYYYDFPALLLFTLEDLYGFEKFPRMDVLLNQYTSFICNLSVPLVGTGFGYLLYKSEKENIGKKLFTTKFRVYFFYAMGIVLTSCVAVPTVVILYYSNVHNRFWASVNVTMSKIFFVFSLGVILLGFSENIGTSDHHGNRPDGPSRSSLLNINLLKAFKELVLPIVNWTPAIILSRLSYAAYLVQMPIIMIRAGMLRYPNYLSYYMLVTLFFGDVVTVYFVAFFVSLLIEMPFNALSEVLFVEEKKKEIQENDEKNK